MDILTQEKFKKYSHIAINKDIMQNLKHDVQQILYAPSPWNENPHSNISSCHCQQNRTVESLTYPLEECQVKRSATECIKAIEGQLEINLSKPK